jgi:ATP-dependent Clp protease protease subunit
MTGHIFIYGEIGAQVTAKSIQDQIEPNATDYEVHISSVGGDVYEGYAIYGILSNLKKPTTVIIEGLCASIATLIAQAGDKVIMTKPAEFMIHNPNVTLSGESDDLINAAGQLDRIKNTIISVYQKRTGLSPDELSMMMDNETWMTADEAKQRGFVDEIQDKLKAVAYIDVTKIKMSKEKNKLVEILDKGFAELKNLITGESPKNVATLTLANGVQVVVGTESETPTAEEMVGATVSTVDGSPLEDGVYQTAEGIELTIQQGTVSAAIQAPAPEPEETTDPMEDMKKKLEEMQALLDAKNQEVEAKAKEAEVSNKKIAKFEASIKALEAKYNELKNVTVGEQNGPQDAPDKNVETTEVYDPATEDLRRFLQGRRLI